MLNWKKVALALRKIVQESEDSKLDSGQKATVMVLADRIESGTKGQLLADEVGMGKTRIAAALIEAVRQCGGRTAIVLPAGLGAQWQKELRSFNPDDQTLLPLRSYESFISGFMEEGKQASRKYLNDGRARRLADRHIQRELPKDLWSDEKILMVSHTLANMKFQTNSDKWRRALSHYVAQKMVGVECRPGNDPFLKATKNAASAIVAQFDKYGCVPELSKNLKKTSSAEYRSHVLPLIGYALGKFDLIIIDEAHKARGIGSSLSRILTGMLLEDKKSFRLGMTATPVEIDSEQWINTLQRILGTGAEKKLAILKDNIDSYVKITERLKIEVLDEALTTEFEQVAGGFKNALSPWVLRRDKRHDAEYAHFVNDFGDYRQLHDHIVTPQSAGFTHEWLRRLCAVEALSLLPQGDPAIKRARLSMAQGFGHVFRDGPATVARSGDEESVEEQEENADNEEVGIVELDLGQQGVWLDAYGRDPINLYAHPALLEAVRVIESYTLRDEKVLVFGRFIKPMTALTRLLDMREMLRRLHDGKSWPGGVIPDYAQDVLASLRENSDLVVPSYEEISSILAEQHKRQVLDRNRDLRLLSRDLKARASEDTNAAFLVKYLGDSESENASHGHIGTLLEALSEFHERQDAAWSADELINLFSQLREDLMSDMSEEDLQKDSHEKNLASRLTRHLQDYNGREGNFARMMWSQTAAQTRRILQSSFNRTTSWPKVLIAQSQVGREGLNLHVSCSAVVLLHAEWNPGVVEQQIGRVDRKESLWLRQMREWRRSGKVGQPPRINIHRIVVAGSYDEFNWDVLKNRWANLRAQLHGQLPLLNAGLHQALELRLVAATPNFAP